MSEIPEDKKELIDTLTSGYAFCEEDARELVELAAIGQLAVEARRLYGIESGEWFTAECALGKAADDYLAKQPKP